MMMTFVCGEPWMLLGQEAKADATVAAWVLKELTSFLGTLAGTHKFLSA
jgi:hypothetical protein